MKLPKHSLTLVLLTPCWAGGANPADTAEIRVPSIRGQLRWWLRALFPNTNAHEMILGSAVNSNVRASAVSLVVRDVKARLIKQNLEDYTGRKGNEALQQAEPYFLWPLRPTRQSPQKRAALVAPDDQSYASFTLEWTWLPPFAAMASTWQPKFEQALKAWSLLGTLGTRATRGYGSVWDPSCQFSSPADFSRALEFLPRDIHVRLLDGQFDQARDALAAAAKWLRSLRLGTSRYGGNPSKWGRNDHDVALGKGGPKKVVYRPALGLPLVQRFQGGPVVETRLVNSPTPDRYPSPVHVKVVIIAGRCRIAILIFDRHLLSDGTMLEVGKRTIPVSLELVDHIRNTGLKIH